MKGKKGNGPLKPLEITLTRQGNANNNGGGIRTMAAYLFVPI